MKKTFAVLCLLLAVISLSAAELKPYKISDPTHIRILNGNTVVKMMGKEYDSGFFCNRDGYILFAPEGSYKEMVLSIGPGDGYKSSVMSKADIYADGRLIKSVSLNYETVPQKLTLSVSSRQQVKIAIDIEGEGSGIVLTDISFR